MVGKMIGKSMVGKMVGKVIGKSGRNISAIRTVLFAVNAKKGGKKARLDVVE